MTYQGLGPGQSIVILLVLVALAAAPWFVRKALETDERERKRVQGIREAGRLPDLLSPVQAAARAMYGEAYGWVPWMMDNYDHSPEVRELWERAAELRIKQWPETADNIESLPAGRVGQDPAK